MGIKFILSQGQIRYPNTKKPVQICIFSQDEFSLLSHVGKYVILRHNREKATGSSVKYNFFVQCSFIPRNDMVDYFYDSRDRK